MMGFSHMVIYDDFSSDNVTMLDTLYKEHQRSYLTVVPPFGVGQDKFTHRAKTAEHCFINFHHLADWMINIDVDEFLAPSPKYAHLSDYFRHEVPETTHILQVGATRFGWSGQRNRFTYRLQEVCPCCPPFPISFRLTTEHGGCLSEQISMKPCQSSCWNRSQFPCTLCTCHCSSDPSAPYKWIGWSASKWSKYNQDHFQASCLDLATT